MRLFAVWSRFISLTAHAFCSKRPSYMGLQHPKSAKIDLFWRVLSLLRVHGGAHFIRHDRWQGQEECDGTLFCLFCGNCDGTCVTTLTGGHIESTCNLAYTSLKVSVARQASKRNPCTDVPSPCPMKTCTRWVCSYALAEHVATHRIEMPPPRFKLPPSKSQAVLDAFNRTCQRPRAKQSSPRGSDLP